MNGRARGTPKARPFAGCKAFDSLESQRMNGDAQEHSGSMKRSRGANASALS